MRRFFSLGIVLLVIQSVSSVALAGQAPLPDNLSFQISSNPALYFSGSGFDATRVMDPSIVKVGGTYYMYYTGLPFGNDDQIGLATSTDGLTWTRSSQNPVLPHGEQSWSGFRTKWGRVLYDNGTFKMWYIGDDQNLYATEYLGYATSMDGVHWTPYSGNPIHTSIAAQGLTVVGIAKLSGIYYLYWEVGGSDLNLSTSSDGIHWTDYSDNPIAPYPDTEVVQTGGEVLLFTHNGIAQSNDGIHFTLSSQPMVPNGVSAALVESNLLKVWFTKGDGNINWDYGNEEIDYATAALPTLAYVALGDSYSSGEGNPPFLIGTDNPADYCRRSKEAYPEVLGQMLGAGYGLSSPLFYACSGATTSNITTNLQYILEKNVQIKQPGVDPSARLVTMTIGGDDAGFSGVLKTCIEQKKKADAINAEKQGKLSISTVGPVAQWLGFASRDPSCADSTRFVNGVKKAIDNVLGPVKNTEQALVEKVDPDNTSNSSIIVVDYPHLFPSSPDEQSCPQLSKLFTPADETFLNTAADRLDGVLQEAAALAGVNFVDVRPAFTGHEICGSDGSYLNGFSIALGEKSCVWYSADLSLCLYSGLPISGSFHPNASGQLDGYAAAIAQYIATATQLTPAGFPANPPPSPEPPTSSVKPADGIGTLTVHPVTTRSSDCSGTYQAGQEVQVSGGGFVPGTDVNIVVSSPGLSPSGELGVRDVTADSMGNISTVVRIPLSASGFVEPRAAAGLVFVDAIGWGSSANHWDDVAMVGLAPPGSTCGAVE